MGRRHANITWTIPDSVTTSYEAASLCVLMDLRDELQKLNRLLHCHNFTGIPQTLKTIAKQTKKRKYVRKVKP